MRRFDSKAEPLIFRPDLQNRIRLINGRRNADNEYSLRQRESFSRVLRSPFLIRRRDHVNESHVNESAETRQPGDISFLWKMRDDAATGKNPQRLNPANILERNSSLADVDLLPASPPKKDTGKVRTAPAKSSFLPTIKCTLWNNEGKPLRPSR